MKKLYREIKAVLKMAGMPGWLLLGYYAVQIIFARQKSDMGAVDGSAVVFASYALGAGLYCINDLRRDSFSRRFFSLMMFKTCILWFVLYTVMCGVSALWSPMFMLSGYRAVECLGMMMLNAAVMKNLVKNLDEEGIMLWAVSYAFVMMAMIFANSMSSGSLGVTLYILQFPSTIFFYLAFYYAPKNIMKYPMMTIALACKSTTGYIGMAMGMCSLMFGKAKYRTMAIVMAIALGGAVATMGIDGMLNNTVFASKGGAMENGEFQFDRGKTSGRSDIWEPAIDAVIAEGREWYGYGFVAGETMFVQDVIGGQVIGMHNGFLSAFVGTGYIGLLFFSLFMIGYVRAVFNRKIPKQYKAPLIATMCCVLMHTIGNPGLGFRVYGTWMPAMFIVMLTVGLNIKFDYMKDHQPPYSINKNNNNQLNVTRR